MDLFIEAGVFAYVGFALFVIGIVVALRAPKRAAKNAGLVAAAIVALGIAGAGMGQRLVDGAVSKEPDLNKKVEMLSLGTREAAANELLAGMFALALLALGAGVQTLRGQEDA